MNSDNNTCYRICPVGYRSYIDPGGTKRCSICNDVNCEVCHPLGCSKCVNNPSIKLFDYSCGFYPTCPGDTTLLVVDGRNTCVGCQTSYPNCLDCHKNQCNKCEPGYYLDSTPYTTEPCVLECYAHLKPHKFNGQLLCTQDCNFPEETHSIDYGICDKCPAECEFCDPHNFTKCLPNPFIPEGPILKISRIAQVLDQEMGYDLIVTVSLVDSEDNILNLKNLNLDETDFSITEPSDTESYTFEIT